MRLVDLLISATATLVLTLAQPLWAHQVVLDAVDVASAPAQTRLTLHLSGAVSHRVFTLEDPDRVVLDIPNTRLSGQLPPAELADPILIGLRSGVRDQGELRIVMDLRRSARVKSFPLTPDGAGGHRLILELIPRGNDSAPRQGVEAAAGRAAVRGRAFAARPAVIAIDAGHGGQDPGAIGSRGTQEKEVTLAIARRLAALVAKEPGMRSVMIRDDDRFVHLHERILKAREAKADLFISIHADAFTNQSARGSSVFTLSERGATSEAAKWLAERENSADLLGGVDLKLSDDVLANVLLNMAQNATLEQSGEAASAVLRNLSRLGDTHKAQVQKAGFVVLKSPDIPSMLIETAFISNPEEEARLVNPAHQQRLAEAIMAGIKAYLRKYPLPGTAGAQASATSPGGRSHVVQSGDTLSVLAKRYGVTVPALRTANRLDGDHLRVGQALTIPEGD